ncbi:MAG: hypothetical protein GY777_10620 [Candidatus Brocadiaceae bacterium]|nr:hypothetical protein [Candidatus Brocadiaceae bacterium]
MWGEKDISEWKAVVGVSFMMFINLILLGLLFQYLGIIVFVGKGEPVPKKIIILIMLVLCGLNYFLFMHSEKYKSITRECEKESTKKRKKNTMLLWLYTILSFLLPILLTVLIKNKYYS